MTTTTVSSASELQATLAAAKGGDTILVKDGSYGWVTLDNLKFNDYVTIKSADGNGGAVFKHIGLNNTSHIRLDSLTAEFGPTTPELHHLKAIEVRAIDILTVFQNFADYWTPFLGQQGAAPTYLMSVDVQTQEQIRARLQSRLRPAADGTIALNARAWAIQGTV